MSGVDDLRTEVAAVKQASTDAAAKIKELADKISAGGLSDAEAESIAQELKATADGLEAAAGLSQPAA